MMKQNFLKIINAVTTRRTISLAKILWKKRKDPKEVAIEILRKYKPANKCNVKNVSVQEDEEIFLPKNTNLIEGDGECSINVSRHCCKDECEKCPAEAASDKCVQECAEPTQSNKMPTKMPAKFLNGCKCETCNSSPCECAECSCGEKASECSQHSQENLCSLESYAQKCDNAKETGPCDVFARLDLNCCDSKKEVDDYFGDCYQNKEYYQYHPFSFYELERYMSQYRLPQPDATKKKRKC